MIISGPGEKSTELYQVLAHVVANMEEGEDYTVDEKQKQEMKENLHEWADTVMQGLKKRLRESGRLI